MSKALSHHDDLTSDRASSDFDKERARSISRGREYQSSGRGGAGNIRQASASREPITDGPDDFSSSRGREYAVNPNKTLSTGRGGAGNIHSPSRDASRDSGARGVSEYEKQVIHDHLVAEQGAPHSSGRGGLGNMSTSRSRSRGPASPPLVHSTGRGGIGNIKPGHGDVESLDYAERKEHAHTQGIHSTGRGGLANLTEDSVPEIEHHVHPTSEVHSTGRGGLGNIRD